MPPGSVWWLIDAKMPEQAIDRLSGFEDAYQALKSDDSEGAN